MHARIYDFTLGAGGMQRLPVVGDFFKVISATGTININADTGATLDLMPGQGLREFSFNTLTITDRSGAANSGKILVGFSGMVDDRVTGEVSVIDGGRVRSMTGVAYMGWVPQPAVAGLFSHCQLWNPVGSGKRLVVEQFICASAVATGFVHLSSVVALAGLSGYGKPKRLGLADSVAEVRREALAAESGVRLLLTNSPVMTSNFFIPREPIVIGPGYGYSVTAQSVNQDCSVSFEWFEESV